jgi:hypothetical protein
MSLSLFPDAYPWARAKRCPCRVDHSLLSHERRSPTNPSPSHTDISTAVQSARTFSSPRALILGESSAVFGQRLR